MKTRVASGLHLFGAAAPGEVIVGLVRIWMQENGVNVPCIAQTQNLLDVRLGDDHRPTYEKDGGSLLYGAHCQRQRRPCFGASAMERTFHAPNDRARVWWRSCRSRFLKTWPCSTEQDGASITSGSMASQVSLFVISCTWRLTLPRLEQIETNVFCRVDFPWIKYRSLEALLTLVSMSPCAASTELSGV